MFRNQNWFHLPSALFPSTVYLYFLLKQSLSTGGGDYCTISTIETLSFLTKHVVILYRWVALNLWLQKLWNYLLARQIITISDATYGHLALLRTFYCADIHHFLAIASKIADGIAVKIVAVAKNCYLNQFKPVSFHTNFRLKVCFFLLIFVFVYRAGRFSFPESEWTNVSSDAKDLICKLLVKEAPKRLSAEAVLNHPWIKMVEDTEDKIEKRRRALKTPGIIRR